MIRLGVNSRALRKRAKFGKMNSVSYLNKKKSIGVKIAREYAQETGMNEEKL